MEQKMNWKPKNFPVYSEKNKTNTQDLFIKLLILRELFIYM